MTDELERPSGRFQPLLKYFGFVMVVVYISVGMVLLLMDENTTILNRNTRLILGGALILYGIFRAWRAIKVLKNERPD